MDGIYEKTTVKHVKTRCQHEKMAGKHENMRGRHEKMVGKQVKMQRKRDFSGFHRIRRIFLLNTTKLLIKKIIYRYGWNNKSDRWSYNSSKKTL